MQHKAKVSIVMPVLNRNSTIEKAIRSVIDQKNPEVELIVIDGGSTDGTLDIIKKYSSHIAYWHSQPDGSSALAANIGIEKTQGDYIALLMADDWYEPKTFELLFDAIQKNSQVDVFTFGSRVVYFDKKTNEYRARQLHATASSLKLSFYNICFQHSAICCRFIKKDLYHQIGGFSPFNKKGEHVYSNDKDFLLKVVMYNSREIFIDYMSYNYLAHAGSPSFNNSRKSIMRLCEEHLEIAENFYGKNLTWLQKLIIIYWHKDQSCRLMLYQLLEKQYKNASQTIQNGIKKSFLWPIFFIYTLLSIFVKRTLRLILKGRLTKGYEI